MKKIIALFLLAAAACFRGYADEPEIGAVIRTGRTIAYYFTNSEADELSLIPQSVRKNMVSLFKKNEKPQLFKNILGGDCCLEDYTGDYFKVKITDVSSAQGVFLPYKNEKIEAMVFTVDGGNSPDSQIRFYDAAGTELPTEKFFTQPVLTDFLDGSKQAHSLTGLVPFLLASYELSPEGALTATLNVKGSMTEEDYARIEPFIANKSITYNWDGKKYVLLKK